MRLDMIMTVWKKDMTGQYNLYLRFRCQNQYQCVSRESTSVAFFSESDSFFLPNSNFMPLSHKRVVQSL